MACIALSSAIILALLGKPIKQERVKYVPKDQQREELQPLQQQEGHNQNEQHLSNEELLESPHASNRMLVNYSKELDSKSNLQLQEV